ncbi:MAG: ABC transporter permease [Saprospiraceae bacterium]|nr:ABC transporter permease [Saprospiraceae bacterium]
MFKQLLLSIKQLWFGLWSFNPKFPVRWMLVILFVGIFLEFLASDKPIVAKVEGSWYMPAIGNTLFEVGLNKRYNTIRRYKWSKHDAFMIMPLVPYASTSIDLKNASFKGPFDEQNYTSIRYRHWLGTDKIGRDVLAGLLNGCRVVLKIIFLVGIISGFLGLILGGFSGFYGDDMIRWSLSKLLVYSFGGILFAYVSYMLLKLQILESSQLELSTLLLAFLIPVLGYVIVGLLHKLVFANRLDVRLSIPTITIPLDSMFYFVIVLLTALPVTVMLLAILSYFQTPSLVLTMSLFGLVLWKGIARIVRGEVLRVKGEDYIEAARQLGLKSGQIFWKHIYPNIRKQFYVVVATVVSLSLLIESALSFLGIGMAVGEISWGVLLNQGKLNISAYWLSLFPGILLVITVYSLNTIAKEGKRRN